jgi:cysteinyl-tRNA synthetase
VRLYLLQPHYRSPIAYSDAAIAESEAALGRIDNFTERATERVGSRPTEVPKEFIDAMNDDLGASAALAVLHNAVREGNQALEAGDRDQIAHRLGEVNGMLRTQRGLADRQPSADCGCRRLDQRAAETMRSGPRPEGLHYS